MGRYFDFFTRPDQHYSVQNYEDRLGVRPEESEENESAKYQNLFSDCFGHHAQFNLDTLPEIRLVQNNTRRFVSNDSLSSYFLDKLYNPPSIYLSQNIRKHPSDLRSFDFFVRSITDNPVTKNNPDDVTDGSNVISFLVGDVGTGKTLLLCKTIREIRKRERLSFVAPGNQSQLLVPVYFDFEYHMKGDGGRLLNITDDFYLKLAKAIDTSIQLSYAKDFVGNTSRLDSFSGTGISQLISLVQRLHESRIRLLLILDNLDGYHYHYSKYTFFPEYHRLQVDSIQRNITGLITSLTHGEQLGMLGLSVVIAARRYVYQDCLHTRAPETTAEFNGAVFQLDDANEQEVVSKRLELFEAAIREIETDSRLRSIGEDYKKTLSRLRFLFGIRELTRSDPTQSSSAGAMRTLRQLCHHGNRNLVAFLSNLRLDHREEAELIERFFWDKPHTLVLLYIADLCEKYTQKHGHFPNLFLVDSLVQREPNFPKAHKPHLHTYWLKYLILSYVAAQPDGMANTNQLFRTFIGKDRFDDELVRLVLGSLSTSKQSRCLEPEPGEKSIPSRVTTTPRGHYLVSNWESFKSPFAFSFTYLQLVIDDYLLSYPKSIWREIYSRGVDLQYLFQDKQSYGQSNKKYLSMKMRSVIAFLSLLRCTLDIEAVRHPALFADLTESSSAILPNFRSIESSLFDQYQRIIAPLSHPEELLSDLREYSSEMHSREGKLRSEIEKYYSSGAKIEE